MADGTAPQCGRVGSCHILYTPNQFILIGGFLFYLHLPYAVLAYPFIISVFICRPSIFLLQSAPLAGLHPSPYQKFQLSGRFLVGE